MIDYPDGTVRRTADILREKLADARFRFELDRTQTSRAEYLRLLRLFADLVLREIVPNLQG